MNIFWVTAKDYNHLIKYHKNGMLKKQKMSLRNAIIELTVLKIFYFSYILILPIFITGLPWYHVVAGFVITQMVAGILLACIFQLAHVMETSEFPAPSDDRKMENSWAVHQVLNTTNFAPNNKPLSWFIGGLNYQIEHHLFPQVCHIHYPKLSVIVKQTAEEYNLPYHVQPTFLGALWNHKNMLEKLGKGEL
jgi:linoleoyl-CoA desaturase